jgi:hypothetical protein
MHFKMILRRKETNGFGDKAVLAFQAQCASLPTVEEITTQRDFTIRLKIASQESLSSYLHHFSVVRDNAEMAGNEYSNDALVDLFLSSLRTDNTAYYSILHTTLETNLQMPENSFCRHGTQFHSTRRTSYLQWLELP